MSSVEAEDPTPTPGIPDVPINFVPATAGETFSLGPLTIRIMEDGSRTGRPFSPSHLTRFFLIGPDNRIGAVELTVPANTKGPPAHWHEMHDETFLVTQGTIRFTWHPESASKASQTVDANAGDYVVVPIRAPHTFCNPSDQEAKFFNTFTPAFYVNYFKLLASFVGDGKVMTPEANIRAMASFATIPIPK
ncbi:RmlC-like cupin domain-containing protein [Delphinella strobiligena]|nr:RmlC-like cupin domain-containing protein [Delphinella strobiligena]